MEDSVHKTSRAILFLIGLAVIVIAVYVASTTPPTGPSGNISLLSPGDQETVGTAFVATGTARVFENQFNWALLDPSAGTPDQPIASGTAYAYAPDVGQFGYFSVPVHVPTSFTGSTLIFEVFDYSAKDGTKQDTVSLPLLYDPSVHKAAVATYFPSSTVGGNTTDCAQVFPLYRTIPASTVGVAKAALTHLLEGPTDEESGNGFFTSIPSGVTIQNISIADGTISADFSKALDEGVAGSCRVTSIRSQITNTLEQFPTVSSVVLSIDGQTEGILQP